MSFFSGLFGDQSDAYNNYAQQMQQLQQQMQALSQPYNFYSDIGKQGTQKYYDAASSLMQNPNALQDSIAKGYTESPYQSELLKRTTSYMNQNAANTGMLGAGRADQALQDNLLAMSGQFMNDYIDRGMKTYGEGFNAIGQFPQYGMRALDSQTDINSNALDYGQQAAGAQLQADRSKSSWLPNLIGGVIGTGASFLGGGMGAGANGGFGWSSGFKNLVGSPRSSTLNAGY